MIQNVTLGLVVILISEVGILIAERRTAFFLGLAAILMTIIFFII